MTKIIEINHLTKTYQDLKAVDDISLTINQEEIFGFIGPNGAGKSTTIKMLLNFVYPTSGSAKILGKDCVKESQLIKKEVGYVSSDVRYYDAMSSMDIFNYTASFHQAKNAKVIIDYYIDFFDINPTKKIKDLSLGNKKKIAIVSALIQDPKLLILDEPTNGLDPMIQHRLFELLETKRSEGMTIFLSSHDLHEIQAHCDRAGFIKNGKMLAIEDIKKEIEHEKKVSLLSSGVSIEELLQIGATNIVMKEAKLEFIYAQDINKLIHLLNQKQVENLVIKPLDLEDKFLSMYEQEIKK